MRFFQLPAFGMPNAIVTAMAKSNICIANVSPSHPKQGFAAMVRGYAPGK
jgi:hypothetical protein